MPDLAERGSEPGGSDRDRRSEGKDNMASQMREEPGIETVEALVRSGGSLKVQSARRTGVRAWIRYLKRLDLEDSR